MQQEQINAATEWWATAVTRPKFDNGDSSADGGLASTMAGMLVSAILPEQREVFKRALGACIATRSISVLSCDYAPDATLSEAMAVAGIPSSNAPWKTVMWLSASGGVKVAAGYRAEPESIYEPVGS